MASGKRSWIASLLASLTYLWIKGFGGHKGVRVLCYHRVGDHESGYLTVPNGVFREQMKRLSDHGYRTISLTDLLEGRGDEKSVVITFDDGYLDNYENAFPAMKEYGFFGTIFLIARKIGEPDFMKIGDILAMKSSGFEFGSHTLSHPNLKTLSSQEKASEITDSKLVIEKLLDVKCDYFCYPFGHYDQESMELLKKAGYRGACSNIPGANQKITEPFLIKRTEIAPHDTASEFGKKIAGAYDLLHQILHKLRGRP